MKAPSPKPSQKRGALSWFSDQTKSLYIARPDQYLNDLIYKHPDVSIPRGAKLTVRASECALFFREGRCIGRIDPGSVPLDTANIPFLGHLVVDKLTAGNHFLCELFFVSTNETTLRVPEPAPNGGPQEATVPVGQYRDLNSAKVVQIRASLSYTVKVQDPVRLVIGLGGQSAYASHEVEQVLAGRLLSQLRQAVGRQVLSRPVLDVVSNVDAEIMSNELRTVGHAEFIELGVGVGRMFNLALSLDDESQIALRAFGERESELALQAKGSELARHDGFAQFNLVQGQRAAMEGLGSGLATGKSPMIMSGMNVGGAFQAPPGVGGSRGPAPRSPAGPGGAILSGQASFLIIGDAGASGPYSARQLALLVLSKGQSLDEVIVRRADDPPDVTFTADMEPAIVTEFQRRAPPKRGGPTPEAASEPRPRPAPEPAQGSSAQAGATASTMRALDAALLASVTDGILLRPSVTVLANMAVALGLAPNAAAGVAVVLAAAERLGVRVDE